MRGYLTAKKNIRSLLNKDKEKEKKDKEDFNNYSDFCGLCKNFEDEEEFCPTYNCYPYKTVVPPDDFCDAFTVDKVKKAEIDKLKRKPRKLQM